MNKILVAVLMTLSVLCMHAADQIEVDASGVRINDSLAVTDTTVSSSKDSGALVVEGGIGAEGEIIAGEDIRTRDSSGTTHTQTGSTIGASGTDGRSIMEWHSSNVAARGLFQATPGYGVHVGNIGDNDGAFTSAKPNRHTHIVAGGGATAVKIDGNTGNVGIGTLNPGFELAVVGSVEHTGDLVHNGATNKWVFHTPDDGRTDLFIAPAIGGVWQWNSQVKLSNNGNVHVSGNLSKGGGTFLIDHPLDPENKDLYHGFVEAPRYDLIYRGVTRLKDGSATVLIDAASNMTIGTFEKLTQNVQIFLQNTSGWEPVKGEVRGGTLHVVCKNASSTDSISWMVVAERADAYIKANEGTDADGRLITEVPKKTLNPAALRDRAVPAESKLGHAEVVTEASGTKGYVRHPHAFPNSRPLPKRKLIRSK